MFSKLYDTRLSLTECHQRLRATTLPDSLVALPFSYAPGMYARIRGERLRLRVRRPVGIIQVSRLSLATIRPTPTGCRIRLRVRLPGPAIAFLVLWLTLVGLTLLLVLGVVLVCIWRSGCAVRGREPWLGILVPIGLAAAGVFIVRYCRADALELIAFPQRTLDAQPAAAVHQPKAAPHADAPARR